jgi:hypothetical protein
VRDSRVISRDSCCNAVAACCNAVAANMHAGYMVQGVGLGLGVHGAGCRVGFRV